MECFIFMKSVIIRIYLIGDERERKGIDFEENIKFIICLREILKFFWIVFN